MKVYAYKHLYNSHQSISGNEAMFCVFVSLVVNTITQTVGDEL